MHSINKCQNTVYLGLHHLQSKTHSAVRPISITPVITRIIERIVVRDYIYPALLNPPALLSFSDQFAFRPSGSTTAALITILHTITNLLFSKAFDTVRHPTLLNKFSQMHIPDHIYNWLVEYFHGHSHCSTPNTVVRRPHCLTYRPASYRGLPLDLHPMLSPQPTSAPSRLETVSASTQMIHTS